MDALVTHRLVTLHPAHPQAAAVAAATSTAEGLAIIKHSDPQLLRWQLHLPVTVDFTVANNVKKCPCIACPNWFSPRASRRACDKCSMGVSMHSITLQL